MAVARRPLIRVRPGWMDLPAVVEAYAWHLSGCDAFDFPRSESFWRDGGGRASELDDRSRPCTCGFRRVIEQLREDREAHEEIGRQMWAGQRAP